jgi:hypothetical protein
MAAISRSYRNGAVFELREGVQIITAGYAFFRKLCGKLLEDDIRQKRLQISAINMFSRLSGIFFASEWRGRKREIPDEPE